MSHAMDTTHASVGQVEAEFQNQKSVLSLSKDQNPTWLLPMLQLQVLRPYRSQLADFR